MNHTRGFTVLEAFGLIFIVGILAAMALPAYESYKHRAMNAGMLKNLRHLYDASVSYYTSEVCPLDGPLPRQFPMTVTSTPSRPACDGTSSVKLTPNAVHWDNLTWEALQFAVKDPSYFQYDYVSMGVGAQATFTAGAHGDLNCDGIFSTFERVGHIDANGDVSAEAGLFKNNPSE